MPEQSHENARAPAPPAPAATKAQRRPWAELTREERRALIVGNSLEHDDEDVEFWRNATPEMRGDTLFKLLMFAADVLRSREPLPEDPLLFPGIPKRRQSERSGN